MCKFEGFDLKFLIGRDPGYIKPILYLSLTNHL